MKKTVAPKKQAPKPKTIQSPTDQSIQDTNLTSQETIMDKKGIIPVEDKPFDEPIANDLPLTNDEGEDETAISNKEMMEIIRKQNDMISEMKSQNDHMQSVITDTLKPKVEPGKHTTWAYRYAILPSEKYGDGVIVSWRTKKGANIIDKNNFVTVKARYFDGAKFTEEEHDVSVGDFSKVIVRSEPIEAKALFNEVYDERGNLIVGQKGEPVSKVKRIDPISGTLLLMIQPEYSNYYVVLPINEFGGQNFMFNTRFLNV